MKMKRNNRSGELLYRRKPLITAFESRILLDGAAVATAVDALTDVDVQDQPDSNGGSSDNVVESLAPVATPNQNESEVREVAFVDTQIEDYQTLIDSLDDGVEVHLIDSGVDGLEAMVSMLHDQTGIDALHIYSHGDVAELTLGSTTLSLDNLEDNSGQLQTLGESLSEDGDILLYGCFVGANDDGRAFVNRIAELSGADVAASDDITGAVDLDGNWDLEVTSGSIETEAISATDYAAVLAPVVSNLDASLTVTEGDPAVIIDNNITFTGGINYTEGSIRFSLASSNSGDQFTLTSAVDVNASGAISVVDADVYLGNGSGRDRIGSIDETENGTNGQDLVIHFATPLTNSGFETGDLTGWTIYNSAYNQVNLDGDTTNYYYNDGATTGTATVYVASAFSGSYNGVNQSSNVSTGSWALNLTSSGSITFNNHTAVSDGGYDVSGYGSWFGPYAVSAPFEVQVGDQLTLDWSAQNGSDSYDVFGYLVDLGGDGVYGGGDDSRTPLFSERGSTRTWTTTSATITSAGSYAFEFIGGTYDQTGGKAVGASLYIDNVRLISAVTANDSVASTIARQVTYQNTATDSPPARTLTLTATNANGESGSDTMALNIVQANNSPTFSGGATLGAVNEDTTSPAGSSVGTLFNTLFVDPDEAYTPADTLSGIVITDDASTAGQGAWQYSTDAGSTWYAVGTVSNDSGLMLSSSSLIRFVPSADYNGTPGTLDVYAVDSTNSNPFTNGDTRQTYDTTTDGAGDPVSAASVTLSTSINSVNDAPVATAGATSNGLVEAGGGANATPGVDTSSLTVSMSDVDGTPSFDAAALTSNGWSTANGGVTYTRTGTYGTATLTIATGLVSYQLNDSDTDTQALMPSNNVTDSFTVYIRDNQGATDTANAVFSIQGANDTPVAGDGGDSAIEAGGTANATSGSNATGNLLSNVTDVDSAAHGETHSVTAIRTGTEGGSGTSGTLGEALAGQYGSLTLNADGSYTYVVDENNAAVQALRVTGQQLTDNFTYTAADAGGLQDQGTFTITIDGRNDAPVASDMAGSAVEAGGVANATSGSNATGNVLDGSSDVDSTANGESLSVMAVRTGTEGGSGTAGTVGVALAGQYGSLTLNANGSYTYVVDESNAEVQALRVTAQQLTDNFSFTISDVAGLQDAATLAITIDGRNDTPVAGDASANAVEAGGTANATPGSNATGNLLPNVTDVDSTVNGETHSIVAIRTGTEGESGSAGTVGVALAGEYGSLTLNADGSYTYVIDEDNVAVQALQVTGQQLTDNFTYTTADAGGLQDQGTFSVTIDGRNDAPVATAGATSNGLVEAGGVANATPGVDTSSLTVSISDVDGTPSFDATALTSNGWSTANDGVTYTHTGTYGTATLTVATGLVSYQLNDSDTDTQALMPSNNVTDSFTVYIRDNQGATDTANAVFSIQGANDTPVAGDGGDSAIEAGGTANATSGSNATGNLLSNVTDVDSAAHGETHSVTAIRTGTEGGSGTAGTLGEALAGQYGSLTLNADGSYTYVVDENNAAVQALRVTGQQLTDNFTYTAADAGGLQDQGTFTITIDGRNDAPVAGDMAGSAVEAGGVVNATPGSNATGNVLDGSSDADSTANGESLSVMAVRTGTEGGSGTAGTVGVALAGQYGSLTLNANGSYTYVVDESNAEVQALRSSSQQLTDNFTFTISDVADLQDAATLAITIDGRNDTPVAGDASANAVEAGGTANATPGSNATGNLLPNVTDVDSTVNGETHSIVAIRTGTESESGSAGTVGVALAGEYGSLTLNADGSYTYVIDEDNVAVQALRVTGQQLTDSFTYTATDAGGLQDQGTFSVTIDGRNDAPVAGDAGSLALETGDQATGSNATGNAMVNSTDVDSEANGESMTVVGVRTGTEGEAGTDGTLGVELVGQYGSLTLNTDGSYTYVVDDSNLAVQSLRTSNDTLSDHFTFTVSDTAGLQDQATLAITINGSNDAPVAGNVGTGAIEASGIANTTPGRDATGNVLENSNDLDSNTNGESMTVVGVRTSSGATGRVGTALAGQYGSLTVQADGSYTYVVDNDNPTVEALRASGHTLTDNFTFTVSDTGGLLDSAGLSITIDGRNDTPVGTAGSASATLVEDGGMLNGTTGTNSSEITIVLSDVDGTASFDTAVLINNGWSSSNGGLSYSRSGTYGTATLTLATGVVAYQLDNNDADTQALIQGDSTSDSFTLHLLDDQGARSSVNAIFQIQGANDNPVAPDNSGNAIEAGGVANAIPGSDATGNVLSNVTDVDSAVNGENYTVVGIRTSNESESGTPGSLGTALNGRYGSLTLNADGSYTYVVDETNAEVQALRASGQQVVDSFTYTVADASGLQDQATLSIAIDGRNDAPESTGVSLLDSWVYGETGVRDLSTLFHDVDSAANGEALSFTITGLPSGLSYDPATGLVSGEPTRIGLYTLTLTARDAAGSQFTQTVEMEVVSDGTTPATETSPSPSDGTTPPADNTPPQDGGTNEVNVGATDLPNGLVDDGAGSDDSGYMPGDSGDSGGAGSGQDGGVGDSFMDAAGNSNGGDTSNAGDNLANSIGNEGGDTGDERGNDLETLGGTPSDGRDSAGGRGPSGDEIVVMSEPGAIVFESTNPDGNRATRASVEVNVTNDGAVQFTKAQNEAFDIVSLYLSNIQRKEGGFHLTITDSNVDRVQLYTGTLGDGSSLPEWIQLDPRTGSLDMNPPDNVKELIIRVKAINSDGQIRILELQLNANQLQQFLGGHSADAFMPLSEQLHAQQTFGYGERLAMLLDR